MIDHEDYAILSDEEPLGTVAMPSRDHIATPTVMSMINLALMLGQFQDRGRIDIHVVSGAVLTWQRNAAVHTMRGDWLLFVDDDMVFRPEHVARLLLLMQSGFEMVGGLCFKRRAPHDATMYRRVGEAYEPITGWEGAKAPVEVDATGMAFVLIAKTVFEKIAASKGLGFGSFAERVSLDKAVEFFRWDGGLGEDIRFCQDAKAAGVRIFVDTSVEIGHMSEFEISRTSLGK